MESKNHSGQERPLRSSNPNHPPPPVSVSLRATSLQFVNTSGGDDTTADQLKNVQLPAAWWACARKGSGASISLPTIPKSPGVWLRPCSSRAWCSRVWAWSWDVGVPLFQHFAGNRWQKKGTKECQYYLMA